MRTRARASGAVSALAYSLRGLSVNGLLFPANRVRLCMCHTRDEGWRPCPSSLCERRSHVLAHRLATSARDYRYGGLRAWSRWVLRGLPADEED